MHISPQDLAKLDYPTRIALAQRLSRQQETSDYLAVRSRPLPGSELPWRDWLKRNFSHVCTHPFAERHVRLWEWTDSLTPGVRPQARIEVWPRGGGKSSSGELACSRVGVKLSRRFALYICGTQDQADKHVQSVAALFEHLGVGRALNRYGSSKGWRRDQIRTENGFNVAGIGLDAAARGVKLDSYRPDFLLLDDIDARHDSEALTNKKIATITESLLPTGSFDCATLFLQNLIHKDSVVAQLVDGRADFLLDRDVSPVEVAVNELEFESRERPDGRLTYVITRGTPTWDGQNLTTCQSQLNDWGRRAFLREAQQAVEDEEGGLWNRERDIEAHRLPKSALPQLMRIAVSIDPSATSGGDEAGIIVAGIAKVNGVLHGYVLEDFSLQGSPRAWAQEAVNAYHNYEADVLLAEVNNGGEMVEVTISTIDGAPKVKQLHASRGKLTRAEPVQSLYEEGRVHHVGRFQELESQMCTYVPGDPSPDRMDACVWALTDLMLKPQRELIKIF